MEKIIFKLLNRLARSSGVAPLRADEKTELSKEMYTFMEAHPLPSHTSLSEAVRSPIPPIRYLVPQLAAFVLLFTGGSTVFLAESAGPTEPLYAFKRTVNESVLMGISSFSPELRAEIDSQLLARRLLDAETLLASNRASELQSSTLRTDIDNHTKALYTYIQKENAEGDVTSAYRVGNTVETILDAHNSVLYFIATTEAPAEAAKTNELIVALEGKRNDLEEIQNGIDAKLIEKRDELHEEIAEETEVLKEKLEDVHETLDVLTDERTIIDDAASEREISILIENSKKILSDVAETSDELARIEALQQAVSDGEKAHIIISAYQELHEELSSDE